MIEQEAHICMLDLPHAAPVSVDACCTPFLGGGRSPIHQESALLHCRVVMHFPSHVANSFALHKYHHRRCIGNPSKKLQTIGAILIDKNANMLLMPTCPCEYMQDQNSYQSSACLQGRLNFIPPDTAAQDAARRWDRQALLCR